MKTLPWIYFLIGTHDFIMGQPSEKGSSLSLSVTINDTIETGIKEMLELKAAKTAIVLFDEAVTNEKTLEASIKTTCKCSVQNLKPLAVFILRYTSANHMNASDLLSINGVKSAFEDSVIRIDDLGERKGKCPTPKGQKSMNKRPNDELFSDQWALQKLANKADVNWQEGIDTYIADPVGGSPHGHKVIVAVTDTGVDYHHPDLKDAMWTNEKEIPGNKIDDDGNGYIDDVYGYDFINEKEDPMDTHFHGTHCAGVIAAEYNNKIGVTGVVGDTKHKVKIMAIKILGRDETDGNFYTTISIDLRAWKYAADNGAKISSNSYGSTLKPQELPPNLPREFTEEKILLTHFLEKYPGHLFVTSAGNGRKDRYGNYTGEGFQIAEHEPKLNGIVLKPNLLVVGASMKNDKKTGFSNWGIPYVHVMAPGSQICSTVPQKFGSYLSTDGTSMATPHVSGLAALLWSMNGDLTAQEVRTIIEENVQKKWQYKDLVTSGGLIDFGKTLKNAGSAAGSCKNFECHHGGKCKIEAGKPKCDCPPGGPYGGEHCDDYFPLKMKKSRLHGST